ncbi:MAG TPA: CDP-alcohol phosphatidyltransferase family protein [Steroidobacteraceae bacterium]|nr:CDP-alcohol phosphatidyltransferase family protein [Steroidobacteraceae bacterium]
MMPQRAATPPAVAGHVVGHSSVRIWSLTSAERLARQLRRAGATADAGAAEHIVLLRADWVYDEPLVKGLVRQATACTMYTDDGICVAAVVPPDRVEEVTPLLAAGKAPADLPQLPAREIGGSFNKSLKKREPPFLLPLTAANQRDVETRVFSGSYKGVTDFVTRHIWPRPAQFVTHLCARAGITPNMVTSISLVFVLVAMWAFWHGHYGWGLAAGWLMTFLDTVDGKLARVTLNSSKFGDLYDHSIDLLHPPFWWWAWIVGLPAAGFALGPDSIALQVIIWGYILQRLQEGLFDVFFKVPMHMWRRIDSWFRLITARRNPNLAILTVATLLGRPDIGINTVAVWVAFCLVVHAVQIMQAGIARRRGPLVSWLS